MTQSTEQERAEFTDGAWYWVEKEGWHGEPPIIAPAMYKADCKAWYSHGFGGISTCFLKVLEPCKRGQQASRRAQVVPQFSQVSKKKLDYLLEAGEVITGYAIENKDGRRGAIDCHGFVYWWQEAAAPQPPEAAPVQMPEPWAISHHNRVQYSNAAWHGETPDGTKLYTDQQVRQLLAAQKFQLDELAMLTRKLVRSLRKAAPDNESAEKALDYLKRKGLGGNPLRSTQEQST